MKRRNWLFILLCLGLLLLGGCKKPKHEVRYEGSIVGSVATTVVKEGTTIGEIPRPERVGYNFIGWKGFDFDDVITQDLNLEADWEAIEYKITYKSEYEFKDNPNPRTYSLNDPVYFLPATAAGYNFIGWYKDKAFSEQVYDIEQGTFGDVTFYAKWELADYKIEYNLLGGINHPDNPDSIKAKESITLHNPARRGYKFLGWYTDPYYSFKIEKNLLKCELTDINLYAKWEAETYTINYNPAGGEIETLAVPAIYDRAYVLEIPKRIGFDFLGWYIDDEKIEDGIYQYDKNLNLVAKWKEITSVAYKIHHFKQNIEDNEFTLFETDELTGAYGSKVKGEVKDYPGFNSPVEEVLLIKEDGSSVLNYYYQRKTVELTMVYNDGTEKVIRQKYESPVIFDVYEHRRSDYTFAGWYQDPALSKPYTEFKMPSEDAKIYACWGEETKTSNFTFNIGDVVEITSCANGINRVVVPKYIANIPVTVIGEYAFNKCSELKNLVLQEGITAIDYGAFEGCASLVDVKLPESLTRIGDSAFSGCISLKNIALPEGLIAIDSEAFEGCAALVKISVPSAVTAVSDSLFSGCTSLVTVNLPDTITAIGSFAFYDCTSLFDITLPDALMAIGASAFSGCKFLSKVNLPSTLATIGEKAFEDCHVLEKADIGDKVTSIGAYAFKNCLNLKEISIPSSVTSIGNEAFGNCKGLLNITIAPEITTVSSTVFKDCINIESAVLSTRLINLIPHNNLVKLRINGGIHITDTSLADCLTLRYLDIPETVEYVAGSSFSGCKNIAYLDAPSFVLKYIPKDSIKEVIINSGNVIDDNALLNASQLTKVTLPAEVTEIGKAAFKGCNNLAEINLPDTVTEIKDEAFLGCKKLTAINLSENLTVINPDTFNGCASLIELIVPSGVVSIGDGAFAGCKMIEELIVPDATKSIGFGSFKDCHNLKKVVIPDTVLDIKDTAFLNSENIEDLVTPSDFLNLFTKAKLSKADITSGTIIPADAFKDAKCLLSVNLPATISEIKENAYLNTINLKEVNIADFDKWCEITFKNEYANPLKYAGLYQDGLKLTEIIVPDEITEIKPFAFNGYQDLESITLPEGLSLIGEKAFKDCGKLKELRLPRTIAKIEKDAFLNDNALDKVNLTDADLWCGVEFVNKFSSPIYYAEKFYLNDKLIANLILNEGVAEIKPYAFINAKNIKGLVVPLSMTRIAGNSLVGCNEIRNTYYAGLTSDWRNIEIDISNQVALSGYREYGIDVFAIEDIKTNDYYYTLVNNSKVYVLECLNKRIAKLDLTAMFPEKEVVSIGKEAFKGCTKLIDIKIPKTVKYVGLASFADAKGVKKINVPSYALPSIPKEKCEEAEINSGTEIGADAFKNCLNLTSVKITSDALTKLGNDAFSGCKMLTVIQIPEKTIEIGSNCFRGCSNLKTISLPARIREIKEAAFRDCISLKEVSLPLTAIELGSEVFRGCTQLTNIQLSSQLEVIPSYAFSGCVNLKEITIPGSVKEIGSDAFSGCTKIIDIRIPDSVKTIYANAFTGCSNLINLILGKGIERIEDFAFSGCPQFRHVFYSGSRNEFSGIAIKPTNTFTHQLYIAYDTNIRQIENVVDDKYRYTLVNNQNVYLISCLDKNIVNVNFDLDFAGKTVYAVDMNAFLDCAKLKEMTLPGSIIYVGSDAFMTLKAIKKLTVPSKLLQYLPLETLEEVKITEGDLPVSSFASAKNLKSVELAPSITKIPQSCFSGCTQLANIVFANNTTTIADNAFMGCASLEEITIPRYVKEIGANAFLNCSRLSTVTLNPDLKNIGSDAFKGCNALVKVKISDLAKYTQIYFPDPMASPVTLAKHLEIGNEDIINLVIPDGVKKISAYAFNNMVGLTAVSLPKTMQEIGNSAFAGCPKIENVFYAKEGMNVVIKDGNDALKNAYREDIVVTDIKHIENDNYVYTLVNNKNVYLLKWKANTTKLDLATDFDGYLLASIGKNVIPKTNNITELILPEKIDNVVSGAFLGLSKLAKVKASTKQMKFLPLANIYEVELATGDTIYANTFKDCGKLTKVELNSGINAIEKAAFSGCKALMTIIIPNALTTIEDSAFAGCSNLNSIIISKNVKKIKNSAFKNCTSLSYVLYDGSKEEWDNVIIEADNAPVYDAYVITDDAASKIEFVADSRYQYVIIDDTDVYILKCIEPEIKKVNFGLDLPGKDVVIIGAHAFSGCKKLKEIIIPETVSKIGKSAFAGCEQLTSINLPYRVKEIGAYAFKNMPLLMSIVIPNQVTNISEGMFSGCVNLASVKLSENAETIGASAFENCLMLENITLPNNVKEIGTAAFSGCKKLKILTLSSGLEEIGDYAFAQCINLNNLTIPSGVKKINGYAFSGCINLKSLDIPANVLEIHDYAFKDCTGLKSIKMRENMQEIGEDAFSGCINIENIDIPTLAIKVIPQDNLKEVIINSGDVIPSDAFKEASKLNIVTLASSIKQIGNNAFHVPGIKRVNIYDLASWTAIDFIGADSNPVRNADLYLNGSLVIKLEIPNTVRSIAPRCFAECRSITSISIPSSVTSIGSFAFSDLKGLTEITLPASVANIASDAFSGCENIEKANVAANALSALPKDNLKEVVINSGAAIDNLALSGCLHLEKVVVPSSIASIGDYAFNGCESLNEIILPLGVATIGEYAFNDCKMAVKLILPESITYIAPTAFSGCISIAMAEMSTYAIEMVPKDNLKDVVLNSGDAIVASAFKDCKTLFSIRIPATVKTIGRNTFAGCDALKKIYIEDLASWCEIAFGDVDANPMSNADLYLHDAEIKNLVVPNTVEKVNNWAFAGCSSLESLLLPTGVKSIGKYAFKDCTSLKTLVVPENVTLIEDRAFMGCNNIQEVTIMNSVTKVAGNAFEGCGEIKKATVSTLAIEAIPKISLVEVVINGGSIILEKAFNGCDKLATITLPDTITTISDYAFNQCSSLNEIIIPTKVKHIGDYAFSGCGKLQSLSLPNSLLNIGYSAFSACTGLTNVTMPASITSVGDYAFQGCSNLVKVNIDDLASWCNIEFGSHASNPLALAHKLYLNNTEVLRIRIPDAVPVIKDYVFAGASNIQEVVIPKTVGVVGINSFYGCSAISIADIPAHAAGAIPKGKLVNVKINSGLKIEDRSFADCIHLENVEIADSVLTIGSSAFNGCVMLSDVKLSLNTTSIEPSAFYRCTVLNPIDLPNKLKTIGNSAFASCQTFNHLNLPSSVESVSDYAFSGCISLTSITIESELTTIGNHVFTGCNITTATVPANVLFAVPKEQLINITVVNGEIQPSALANCNKLSHVAIYDDVTAINEFAFTGSTNINYLYAPARFVKYIPNDSLKTVDFWDGMYPQMFKDYKALEKVTDASNRVSVIPDEAFTGCNKLVKVNIYPTTIGESAFLDCQSLSDLEFIANVADVAVGAFSNTGIRTLNVPETLKVIKAYTFSYCSLLKDITLPDTLESIDPYAFYCSDNVKSVTTPSLGLHAIPASNLESVILTSGTTIAEAAFCYIENLKYLEIAPDTITTIGKSAFAGCKYLTNVTLPDTVTSIGDGAFAETGLTNIVLPNKLAAISDSVFKNCLDLKSVSMPDAITSIGDEAFLYCESLATINLPTKLNSIGNHAFMGCTALKEINLPTKLKQIGLSCFKDCKGATTVKMGPMLEVIPDNSFENCSALTDLIVADNVQKIGDDAFANCINLKEVMLPSSVSSIGKQAFYSCNKLAKITILNNDVTIGEDAFEECSAVKEIKVPTGAIGSIPCNKLDTVTISGGNMIPALAFQNCDNLKTLKIENVREIGDSAFSGCLLLTNLELDSELKIIDESAFRGCTQLATVILPEGLASIAPYAFSECPLSEITFPESLTLADENSFALCTKLTKVTILNGDVQIADTAFRASPVKEANVPANCIHKIPGAALTTLNVTKGNAIAEGVCQNYQKLKTVKIAEPVTEIGADAFKGCLELTSVVLPATLRSIGDNAFSGCVKLVSITIPASVIQMGSYVFYDCVTLKIKCDAAEMPATWNPDWNPDDRPVTYSE